jgi:hypothetical protein
MKYSSSGNVEWARRICVGNNISVATDNMGNCIIAGSAVSGMEMDDGDGTPYVFSTAGSSDAFLAKFDGPGNLVWTEMYNTGSSGEYFSDVEIDGLGNIYGVVSADSSFGAGSRFTLLKYDSSANLVWSKEANWGQYSDLDRIDADATGNVYGLGWTSDSLYFAGTTINASGSAPVTFVFKMDGLGNMIWLTQESGAIYGTGLEVTAAGNLYATGYVNSDLTLGSEPAIAQNKNFLAKYNSAGMFQWMKSVNSQTHTSKLTVDNAESVYLSGAFYFPVTFDQDAVTLTSGQGRTSFIVRYDAGGMMNWVFQHDGNSEATTDIENLSHDASGKIYVTGTFTDSLILGTHTFYNPDSEVNQGDFFISRFNPALTTGLSAADEMGMSVAPNPGRDLFTVRTDLTDYEIAVFDVRGRQILRQEAVSGNFIFDLAEQEPGVYFLRVIKNGKETNLKLLKM